MIRLHQFPPVFGRNVSPFTLKLETWLRLAEVPYEIVPTRNPARGPKGKLPFMAKTPWEWASKHLTAEPEPLEVNEVSGISERRAYAIRRALSKSREGRQQSVSDLLNDFAGVLESGRLDLGACSA